MAKIYNREKNVYSVDLMIAYVGLFKLEPIEIDIERMRPSMNLPYWLSKRGKTMVRLSPAQAIENPDEYPEHKKKIESADLRYPIMIHEDYHLIDGAHRLVKAFSEERKTIRAYMFSDELMEKFIVNKEGNINIGRFISVAQQIHIFYKRFANQET